MVLNTKKKNESTKKKKKMITSQKYILVPSLFCSLSSRLTVREAWDSGAYGWIPEIERKNLGTWRVLLIYIIYIKFAKRKIKWKEQKEVENKKISHMDERTNKNVEFKKLDKNSNKDQKFWEFSKIK